MLTTQYITIYGTHSTCHVVLSNIHLTHIPDNEHSIHI